MTTPDPEARRLSHGWFGEPWPSGICYADNDDTIVREDMRIPTPVGSPCAWCRELIDEGDQGKAMPMAALSGAARIIYTHKECLLREILGPLRHVQRRCVGACGCTDEPGRTARQEALAVWDWIQTHGV